MQLFLNTLLDGISIGSLYALIALGYTMVYGILRFINFAHGDVVMVGAWSSLLIAQRLVGDDGGSHYIVGLMVLVLAMLLCAMVGFTVQQLAYRPLRNAPRLNVLITAIGVSLFIQNTGQLPWVFGKEPARIAQLVPTGTPLVTLAGVRLFPADAIIIFTAVGLMAGLNTLVYRTRLGLGMRAVAHDRATAALMGVPADRIVAGTFVIGSALAAAGGYLFAIKYGGLNQPADMNWVLLGLKAFVAAVVGGIGNIKGAMIGGLIIGLIEQLGSQYISPGFVDVYVFSLLILVLLVRPSGILGRAAVEKV